MEQLQRDGFARLKVGTPDTYAPHAAGQLPDAVGQGGAESIDGGRRQLRPAVVPPRLERVPGRQRRWIRCPPTSPPQESPRTNPALAAKYPLNILTPKNHAFLNSGYANIARQLGHAGEQSVMIHPNDARARGIAEGELVEVFNDRGRFQAEAQVSDEVRPGVVGLAARLLGVVQSRCGRSVNVVNGSRYADMGRGPTFSDTLVEVRRVEDVGLAEVTGHGREERAGAHDISAGGLTLLS